MMRYLLLLCLCGWISCVGKKEGPVLLIRNADPDLGRIDVDSTHTIHYTVINSGNTPLIVDTMTASCDCSIPIIRSRYIVPGDSTIMEVSFHPPDTGYFDKRVVIRSNTDSIFSIVSFRGIAIK